MKAKRQTPNLAKIGKVTEPRALKGEVKIHLFSREAPWVEDVELLVLKKDKDSSSFPVQTLKIKGPQLTAKLKGIEDRTQAEKWIGSEVWISEDHLKSKPGDKFFLREILGFKVFHEKEIGVIVAFDSNGHQDLIVVEDTEKKQILIPLVKDFIVKIDSDKKTVFMKLPEGLISVNL